jgi:hypothetical protein
LVNGHWFTMLRLATYRRLTPQTYQNFVAAGRGRLH